MAKIRKMRATKPVVETAEPVVEPEVAPVMATTPAVIAEDVMTILEAVVESEPEVEPEVVVPPPEVVVPKIVRKPERKGPTARVLLRSGRSLSRHGNVYRKGQPFIVSGENAIRAWEQDSAFVVERLS